MSRESRFIEDVKRKITVELNKEFEPIILITKRQIELGSSFTLHWLQDSFDGELSEDQRDALKNLITLCNMGLNGQVERRKIDWNRLSKPGKKSEK